MKVFVNGFNLYRAFDVDEKIIENFKQVRQISEVIKDFCINHSFSVINSNEGIIIHPQSITLSNRNINKVVANDDIILILNNEGGIIRFELPKFDVPYEVPNLLSFNENDDEKIIDISCGAKIIVTYTNKATLFSNTNKLECKNTEFCSIKCGREHCLLLDKSGNVYSFGCGSRGQLGHSCLDDEPEPVLIEALAGIKIIKICAGGWHSCALSECGDLYTWGWNSNGQLGIIKDESDKNNYPTVMAAPCVIDVPGTELNITKVAAGTRHTIILFENKHLYGCGWNKYKQLKNDAAEDIYSFTYLHNFEGNDVVDVYCGSWNSAVVSN